MTELTRKGFLGRLGALCLVPLAGWPHEGAAEAETAPGEWVTVGDARLRIRHFTGTDRQEWYRCMRELEQRGLIEGGL